MQHQQQSDGNQEKGLSDTVIFKGGIFSDEMSPRQLVDAKFVLFFL
jgi:hypothetical protein